MDVILLPLFIVSGLTFFSNILQQIQTIDKKT